jgi:hypothetical protein
VPDEVRREAERVGELVRKKLMEVMDLQGDIDALLRDKHSQAVPVDEVAVCQPGSAAAPCGNAGDPVRSVRAGGDGQAQ